MNAHTRQTSPQLSIDRFPRCRGYLKAIGIRLDDPDLTDWSCACILAEEIPEQELVAVGFDCGSGPIAGRDGIGMLAKVEAALASRKAKAVAAEDMESLKAFLGSRGVKVSKLPDDDAYWWTASILWPEVIREGRTGPLGDLVKLIRGMTKKQRQAARPNLRHLPAEWRA